MPRTANGLVVFLDLWTKVYLPSLVPRKKLKSAQQNLYVGDVVMLLDPSLPGSQWEICLVIQVYLDEGGLIRVFKAQTKDGTYLRAVHRLCLLEQNPIPPNAELKKQPPPPRLTPSKAVTVVI